MEGRVKNEARRAALAGRPCLRQYRTQTDVEGLMDKKEFQRMYEAKWGGAPWLNEKDHREGTAPLDKDEGVVVIDMAPPACPEAASEISSSRSSSYLGSRKSTE